MMHIAMAIDTLTIHGAVRRCIELSNALIARGHCVTIFTPTGEPCTWLPTTAEVDTYANMPRHKFTAVMAYGFKRGAYDLLMATKTRVRALYLVGMDETRMSEFLAAPQEPDNPSGFLKTIIASGDWLVCACSSWIRDWCNSALGANVRLLLGGVNRSIFRPVVVRRPEGYPVIMSSGDHRAREGSKDVAHAIEIMRGKGYPDVRLETYFRQGIPQSGMAAKIRLGHLWMDGQRYAGWANSVIEAMACRVPVVCTDIGGVRDFAIDGETALLAPVGDAEVLAGQAMRILQDDALRVRLVRSAYAMAGRFTYANTAERLEGYIEERL